MKKRKRNPYQLTDEEKLDVVDLYARFQTTSQVIDQVMDWKPHAATGDTEKDRKNVRDAIRTCNPKSSAFSFQIALTARRAEYLAESKGTLVTAVCDTAQALAEGLSGVKFDFSSVPINDLPTIVTALKEMVELMEGIGITVKHDISEAVRFGETLDQYPKQETEGMEPSTYLDTRREMWAASEGYELGKSTQIETGTGRDTHDLEGIYPSNYVIPDAHIKVLWDLYGSSENGKVPTVKQMREELEDPELYDFIYGEDGISFEQMLRRYQLWLSDDWSSYTPERKLWHDSFNRDMMWKAVKNEAKSLGIDTDGIYDTDELRRKIAQAKGELPLHLPWEKQDDGELDK